MRILLVDDDDGILQSLATTLKSLPGHDLRTATGGEEALQQAADAGGIDLLITDVVMDPMDGFALRDALTARCPGLRTILLTGYDLSDYAEQTENFQLLQKPFEPAELIAAVRKELGDAATPVEVVPQIAEPPAETAPAPAPEPVVAVVPEPAPPVPEPEPVAPDPIPPQEVPAPQVAAVPVAVPRVAAATAAPPVRAVPAGQPVPVARPATQQAQPRQANVAPRATATAPTAIPQPSVRPAQPAATPRAATPAATAQPAAAPGQPRGVARAVATQPTATANPTAPQTPRATGIPQPTAVAKAVPIARPTAVAAASPGAPTVKAVPTAVPSPSAVPKAKSTVPIAVPVSGAAAPVAKAIPAAPPATVPQAKAVPAAVPTAQPSAVAKARPTVGPVPATPATATPLAPPPLDTADLPAKAIGAYEIHHRLGVGRWGAVYAAVQTGINRPVALKILDPERAKDPEMVQQFTAAARAKAGVQHPSILAVYEAGEQDGFIFYTREYVAGRNLAEVESSGTKLDEATALKVLRVAADGLGYFQAQNTPHTAFDARSLYLGADGHARLANLATPAGEEQQTFEQEVQTLGKALLSVLPAAQKLSPGLRGLLGRMVQTTAGNPKSFQAWSAVLPALKSLEPKVVPIEAAQISAQDRAAVAAIEAARKAQQRSLYLTVGSMVSLLVVVAAVVWYFFFHGREREHDEMVHVPAGDFLFQAGEPATLPEFWIDKYEVTIGQYAKFLKDLEDHPRGQFPDLYERIEHLNQPPLKRVDGGHKPPNWHIFYPRAKGKMEVAGTPTSLDSPVVEVDWWDAYAYAKWRGRELPTEQEWEKAARGTKGQAYPWSDELDPKRVNSGADYHGGNPNAKADIDGFIRYGDVDKQEKDMSPFEAVGMAGNVSEWILDWAVGPDKRTKFPMIKGGSFMSTDVKLDRRITDRRPDAVHDWLGFRTVSRTAPKK